MFPLTPFGKYFPNLVSRHDMFVLVTILKFSRKRLDHLAVAEKIESLWNIFLLHFLFRPLFDFESPVLLLASS